MTDDRTDGTTITPAFDRSQGREELNLAEFPLFYLGQRIPKGLDRLSFENEITDPARNRTVKRRLELRAAGSDGLPTVRDMDVLHSLILIAKQTNDLSSPVIYFSRYQLCEILGWPQNGKSYKRIEEALVKWVSVTLFYRAWWDKEEGVWENLKGFHILDDIELNDYNVGQIGRVRQAELPLSTVRIGERIFHSLHSGNVKRLNLADVFHLKLPAAKRLYGFLDKRFYHNPRLSFDLRTLACEHVGLSREYKSAHLKRKLQPAIDELVALGFIVDKPASERYSRVGHGIYQVHFQRASRATIGELPLTGTKKERTASRQLLKALTDQGVTATTARSLVEDPDLGEARIRQKLDMLAWFLETQPEQAPKNPGGWLTKAIRDDYQPPAGFQTKDEREAQQKRAQAMKEERARAEHQAKEAEARRLEESRRRDDAEQQRIDSYLAALSDIDRERLIDDAIAAAKGFVQQNARKYRSNPERSSGRMFYDFALREYILPLLEEQPAVV